jgi:hypothetical protein
MNVESNKVVVRLFYDEAWDQGRLDIIDELFDDDYVRRDLRPADPRSGPAGMRKLTEDFRAAFPDLGGLMEHLGDRVYAGAAPE